MAPPLLHEPPDMKRSHWPTIDRGPAIRRTGSTLWCGHWPSWWWRRSQLDWFLALI